MFAIIRVLSLDILNFNYLKYQHIQHKVSNL